MLPGIYPEMNTKMRIKHLKDWKFIIIDVGLVMFLNIFFDLSIK